QLDNWRHFHPFCAKHNMDYLFRKQSTTDGDRDGQRNNHRVASQEGPGKALGIMLNPRKRRKSHTAERNVQLFYRQGDELECAPIQSKRVRSPEATQEQLLSVPCQEYDDAVTRRQSAKMQHRPDAGP